MQLEILQVYCSRSLCRLCQNAHSSIAVWGMQEHKTSTIGQQSMRNIAFLLAASLFLQQVQYANANAGHVDPFRSSNYKHHYSNFSGALRWNA